MGYRFKILNGRHEGAEIALAAQRYTLGCGENNSLILSDAAVAEQHLEFFFAQGQLSILRAAGAVKVDGKPIAAFPVDVAPLQLVTLVGEGDKPSEAVGEEEDEEEGDVHFTYAEERTRDWPDRKRIAEILKNAAEQAARKPAPLAGQDKTRKARRGNRTFARISSKRARQITRGVITAGIVATLVTAILFGHAIWFNPSYRTVKRMNAVERGLEQQLAETPIDSRTVHLEWMGEEGEHILIGYVTTEHDLAQLRSLTIEAGLRLDIVSLEGMHNSIDVIAQEHRVYARFALTPLSNRSDKPLQKQHFLLHAEGFVQSAPSFELFHTAILQELPQITKTDLNLTTGTLLREEIEAVLTGNIAFAGVRTQLRNGDLVLTGALFENFHDQLTQDLNNHFHTLPRPPRIIDNVLLVPPFYAEITSLLLGARRAVDIRLNNSTETNRFLQGEKITDDIALGTIENNGIRLRYRGQNLGFPLSYKQSEQP